MTAKKLLLVAVVAACGLTTAQAGWNPFGGGKVPNPLNDAKNQAEQEARRLREERDRAARAAEEQARRGREARDRAAREAEEVARKAREARERVAQEEAKLEELRRRAEAEVARFKKIRQDVERAVGEYDRLQKLAGDQSWRWCCSPRVAAGTRRSAGSSPSGMPHVTPMSLPVEGNRAVHELGPPAVSTAGSAAEGISAGRSIRRNSARS